MPTPKRLQPLGVIDRLLADPHPFGFFQAVRLLERWFERSAGRPDGRTTSDALGERVQFRNDLSLAFPASEIAHLRVVDQRSSRAERLATAEVERIELTPAFIGLLGPSGALPTFYTELLAERETHHRDGAGRAFMDIFLHRAVVLFYQAWRKHRLAIRFEADRHQQFLPLVLSLAGLGPALRDRLHARRGGVSDDTLAYFSGTLQRRPVSAVGLQQVIADYFQVRVNVSQFIGRWFHLPTDNQTQLCGGNVSLGGGAVVGERVWQRDQRLRLVLGPMPLTLFRRFLPGGPAALALRELLTLMTGVTVEYEVRLCLRADDIHGVHLGNDDDEAPSRGGGSARLGWDGFLVTRRTPTDRSDAGYDLHAMP